MAAALLFGSIALRAQNNPYKIDDTCYEYMNRADALIGKEGFEQANEALLKAATAHALSLPCRCFNFVGLAHLTIRY